MGRDWRVFREGSVGALGQGSSRVESHCVMIVC